MKILKRSVRITAIILLLGLFWTVFQYWSISRVGEQSQPQKADAIIVLGAAVWEHGPSPSLLARVEHAWELYQHGFAPYIILSGGQGVYGPTEAQAMANILLEKGIDPKVLLFEDQSTSTLENVRYSKKVMDDHHLTSALIVTDTFHVKRSLMMARDVGIDAYGAPVKDSVMYTNKSLKFFYTLREVLAITKYYIFD